MNFVAQDTGNWGICPYEPLLAIYYAPQPQILEQLQNLLSPKMKLIDILDISVKISEKSLLSCKVSSESYNPNETH